MTAVPHSWYATLIDGDGKLRRFSGVNALPLSADRTKQYADQALVDLVTQAADKELGAGWRFADKADPYKLNASPASDYGL